MSKELKMPFSTVKWNINILRKTGLIDGGRKENRGIASTVNAGREDIGRVF
ncbi:MAG: hypothetical protein Q6368_005565 [Candidatus Baldrarchaeota archaeon]